MVILSKAGVNTVPSTTAHFQRLRTLPRAFFQQSFIFLHGSTSNSTLSAGLNFKFVCHERKSLAFREICIHRLLEWTRPRTTRTPCTWTQLSTSTANCSDPSAHSRSTRTLVYLTEHGVSESLGAQRAIRWHDLAQFCVWLRVTLEWVQYHLLQLVQWQELSCRNNHPKYWLLESSIERSVATRRVRTQVLSKRRVELKRTTKREKQSGHIASIQVTISSSSVMVTKNDWCSQSGMRKVSSVLKHPRLQLLRPLYGRYQSHPPSSNSEATSDYKYTAVALI